MMLDGMLADEGLSKESEVTERKQPGYAEHEWEFKKECIYEDDEVEMICKKCFRQLRMNRTQTTNEAVDAHEINRNCADQAVKDVSES